MSNSNREEANRIIVLIPSLNPDELLVKYVKKLLNVGVSDIILIDDGSEQGSKRYFENLQLFDEVVLLTHEANRGKGAALKTGLQYVLKNYDLNQIDGVVTADSDGQHSPKDTIEVAKKMNKEKNELIFGCREFDDGNVPWKSAMGNKITTFIIRLLYGKKISDTQTGLRGISSNFLEECANLKGDRYEYEIEMLIKALRQKVNICEVPIETIYIDDNSSSHFNAVKDSIRIYRVIFSMFFRFSMSGITSFLIDILLFAFLSKVIFQTSEVAYAVMLSTIISRILSSVYNFIVNKNIVFQVRNSNTSLLISILKYYSLCVVQLICSALLVILVFNKIQWDTTLIKGIVDLFLFFISYQIQRLWVFKEEN